MPRLGELHHVLPTGFSRSPSGWIGGKSPTAFQLATAAFVGWSLRHAILQTYDATLSAWLLPSSFFSRLITGETIL